MTLRKEDLVPGLELDYKPQGIGHWHIRLVRREADMWILDTKPNGKGDWLANGKLRFTSILDHSVPLTKLSKALK